MKTITYNPETHVLVPRDLIADAKQIFCSDVEPNTNGDCIDVIEWFSTMFAAAPQPESVESEPAMWVMKHIRSGDLAQAKPNQKALHPHMWSDAFPLYTTPQPDRVAELEAICKDHGEIQHSLCERIAELEKALKVARDALNTCTHEGFCDYDDATETLAKINEVLK